MEFPQYFSQEWKSIHDRPIEPENNSPCFDCSICLDFPRDPVVTLCGHLYCWPCIYKWLDSSPGSSDKPPQCPVCKAQISKKTIVPLYGRGQSFSESETEGKVIPPRPPSSNILLNSEHQFTPPHPNHQIQSQHRFLNNFANFEDYAPYSSNLSGNTAVSRFHPSAGVFGEMIYERVFGNSQSLYTYPNSYHTAGGRSPRLRRRELEAEESLNRVTIFLFCFSLLCLIVF